MELLRIVGVLCIVGWAQGVPASNSELAYVNEIRSSTTRVVGGMEAEQGQFPYTVSLRMVGPVGGVGACTGSLLSHDWVLTAAHCLARRFTWVVLIGNTNITRPAYAMDALEPYIHEGYDQTSSFVQSDDIGVLKLPHPVPYGPTIQPIRIQSSRRVNMEYPGVQLTFSGFGRTDDWWLGGIVPEILYWVYQLGVTQADCRTWYPASQTIGPMTMCAQWYDDPSQNMCTGDSGGALTMVDEDGEVTQVGIMSFGAAAGCNTRHPQGLVRPDYYHDWIEKQTGINFDWNPEDLKKKL